MSVWGHISAHMKQQHVTAAELSRRTGIKQSSFTAWKKGEYEPSVDAVLKISEALNIPIEKIYNKGKDDQSPNQFTLDANETRLIQNLRSAEPTLRSTIYKMIDAAFENSTEYGTTSASFLAKNDEKLRHYAPVRTRKDGLKRVEGEAAAGLPITTVPDGERMIHVPVKYLTDEYFVIQARGDSMIDANIRDGDFCVFKRNWHVSDGQIMYVQIDGPGEDPEGTIKRVYLYDDEVELASENPAYEPIVYPAFDVHLMGVLVSIVS